ncbi:MAG: hypothetical protein GY937_20075 [bacterium]|nr:hypothetical protein [bacterium]
MIKNQTLVEDVDTLDITTDREGYWAIAFSILEIARQLESLSIAMTTPIKLGVDPDLACPICGKLWIDRERALACCSKELTDE